MLWFSVLGALPFTLALPHVGLYASAVLTIFIGLVLSSTTSTIIVFAQELVPHRFGTISGVFFGVAFGIGGLGAAAFGKLADHTSIEFVYQVCAFCGDRSARGIPAGHAAARALAREQLRRVLSRRGCILSTHC